MKIEALTSGSAALFLDAEELNAYPEHGQFCALVRKVQREHGMQTWKSMDTRLFISGASALLLAWPTESLCFQFSEFETLLLAALSCPADTVSALVSFGESWLLLIRCPLGKVPFPLCEYGKALRISEALAVHIAEHGELLLASDAVRQLQMHFAL